MDKEKLERATHLIDRINRCEKNLKQVEYTQSLEVLERKTVWSINHGDMEIEVPSHLYRGIGALIKGYYMNEVRKLKEEFDKL